MGGPPAGKGGPQGLNARLDAGIVLHQRTDGGAVGECGGEVEVARTPLPRPLSHRGRGENKRMTGIKPQRVKQHPFRLHLRRWHAAEQMRAHVMRFGRRRVVHVAADVEIPVIGRAADLRQRHPPGVAGHVLKPVERGNDLLDMLRAQIILGAARVKLGVSVDEQHLAAPLGGLVRVHRLAAQIRAQHQNTGRDARAVKQVRRQTDDRLDQILLQPLPANLLLGPAPEQHPMRHHRGDHAARLAHRQHVLGEHQIALLARGRTPAPAKPLRELHVAPGVVLAERRIGDHPVEPLQLAALAVHGMQQRVSQLNIRARHAVQQHVQLADRPG